MNRSAPYVSPLPPGQRAVAHLPVQHIGAPLELRAEQYRLALSGLVAAARDYSLDELRRLAATRIEADFHAGSGWSVRNLHWGGVRLADVLRLAQPLPSAQFVRFWDGALYDASLPLADALAPDVLLALELEGAPLTREHGAPLRLIAPAKYGHKSVKWLRSIELVADDPRGFWERRGMHSGADPWREERFA